MAERTHLRDANDVVTKPQADAPVYLSRQDIDKFAALLGQKDNRTATNDGQNVLPSMELTGIVSKCGKPSEKSDVVYRCPSIPTDVADVQEDGRRQNQTRHESHSTANPREMGAMVDKALESHNPQEMRQAAQELAEVATQKLKEAGGNPAALRDLEKKITENVVANQTGVFFEVENGKVVAHIAKHLSDKETSKLINSGNADGLTFHAEWGGMKDLVEPATAELKRDQAKVEHERHALQPNDGRLIGQLVAEQTDEHNLTPKGQKALREALDLVANSNSQANLQKLAEHLPELMTCDGGNVKEAFEDALGDLGYRTKLESLVPEEKRLGAPKHYKVSIHEPGQSFLGGKVIAIEFKNAGNYADDEINVSKYSVRG